MHNPIADVYHFNRVAGNAGSTGAQPNWKLLRQAIAHVAEEAQEMAVAADRLEERVLLADTVEQSAEAFANVADAAIDIVYVSINVLYALGFDPEPLWTAVHSANMAKVPDCGQCRGRGVTADQSYCRVCSGTGKAAPFRRADGKIMKPDGWTPPNLAAIIAPQLMKGIKT